VTDWNGINGTLILELNDENVRLKSLLARVEKTEIQMQMTAPKGVAFTFPLPAVPREMDLVHVGGRKFVIMRIDWHPLDASPVRLFAEELGVSEPDDKETSS
jgi:hypothetical protein